MNHEWLDLLAWTSGILSMLKNRSNIRSILAVLDSWANYDILAKLSEIRAIFNQLLRISEHARKRTQ